MVLQDSLCRGSHALTVVAPSARSCSVGGVVLCLAACTDPHVATKPSDTTDLALRPRIESLIDGPELADTIVEVIVQPGAHWSAAAETDAELERSVANAGGVVAIGFKEPTHALSRLSGRFPAFSRARASELRTLAEQAGATILQTFRNSAAVIAKIDPAAASRLRRLPFVNYLEAPRPVPDSL